MDHGVLVVNFAALQQAGADIQKALNTLDSQLGPARTGRRAAGGHLGR